MTTTPKSVIMAVVIVLGLFALASLGAVTFLLSDGQTGETVAIIVGPMGVAIGAVAGVLASTRTTPELAAGQQLVGGQTVLTGPPVVTDPANAVVPATVAVPGLDTSALITLEQQGIDPTLGHGQGTPPQNANATQNP